MNGFLAIAVRNLSRNRTRTLLVGGAVFAGAFVMLASLLLADGVSEGIVGNLVAIESGAVIASFNDQAPETPAQFEQAHRQALHRLDDVPGVVRVRQRMSFAGVLFGPTGKSANIAVKGIDPAQERPLADSLVPASGHFIASGHAQTFLSQQVASQLQVAAGDQVTLLVNTWGGQVNAVDLTVAGTFANVAPWVDFTAFVPLPAAQDIYGAKVANQYLLDITDLDAAAATAARAATALRGMPLDVRDYRQAGGFLLAIASANRYSFLTFNVLLYLVVAVGIANLLGMVVRERRGELGTLMAIGYSGADILRLLLLEVLVLTAVALAAALVIGAIAFLALGASGIPLQGAARNAFGSARLVPAFHPYQLGVVCVVAAGTSLAGALWPAVRAVRMDTSRILSRE